MSPAGNWTASAGAVFDLDGVLIDSHDQHERSWFMLAEELGKPLTRERFKVSFGMRNERVIPEVFGWADADDCERIQELGDRKERLYRELLKETGLDPLPGVLDLLRRLEDAEIPRSLGSSTSRENIRVCLEVTDLAPFFGPHVTGAEDVARGKPDPEVFLAAAAKIDREPGRCVVFEDAHVGIEAGRAAGMMTIAVTTTHPADTFSDCDRIVASLEEIDLAFLEDLLGEAGSL